MSESILSAPPGPLGPTRLTPLTAASSPDQRLPLTLAIGARLEIQLTQTLSANHIEARLRVPGENMPWSTATRLQLSSPLPDLLARQAAAGTPSGNPIRLQADVVAVSPVLTLRILPQTSQPSGSATPSPVAGTREWMDAQLRQHLPQSRPLASTMESWIRRLPPSEGLDTPSVSQSTVATDVTQRMIATILNRLATTAELTDPVRLPVALKQSGIWLEALMAQTAANPAQRIDLTADLKGQLLRLAQQIRATNQAPPTPPSATDATATARPQPEPGAPNPGGNPKPPPDGRTPAPPTAPDTSTVARPQPEPAAIKPGGNPAPLPDGRTPTPPTEPDTTSPARPQPEPGTTKSGSNPTPLPDGRTPPTPPSATDATATARPQPEPGAPNPGGNPKPPPDGRASPAPSTAPGTTAPTRPQPEPEPGAIKPGSNPMPPSDGRTSPAPSTTPGTTAPIRPQPGSEPGATRPDITSPGRQPPESGSPNPTEPVRTASQAPPTDPAPQTQTRTPSTEPPPPPTLAREVDGMIKQVVTQQLQTLEAGTDPPRWVLELPFKTPAGLLTLEADIQREARAGQAETDGWSMRIRLNLPRLGPLSINLNLRADRLNASLQAEHQAAVEILRQHLATLRQQLEDRQIEIASLHASQRPRTDTGSTRRPPLLSEQA